MHTGAVVDDIIFCICVCHLWVLWEKGPCNTEDFLISGKLGMYNITMLCYNITSCTVCSNAIYFYTVHHNCGYITLQHNSRYQGTYYT